MKKMILVVLLILSVTIIAHSQNSLGSVFATATYRFSLTVDPVPLFLSVSKNLQYENLRSGISYKTFANEDGSIIPNNGLEKFEPARIEIGGEPFSDVLISFLLPSRLYAESLHEGYVQMDYDNSSACILTNNANSVRFFNPQKSITITLPSDGSNVQILLGGNPTVSQSAVQDTYNGYGYIIASFTGTSS